MMVGMVKRRNYIYQYYSETSVIHGEPEVSGSTIKMAVQRLDGYVSADAGPKGGKLITPLVTFSGNRLQLNIDCGAMGEAWVELQDQNGKPIPGYSLEDSVSVDRNGVAQAFHALDAIDQPTDVLDRPLGQRAGRFDEFGIGPVG